MKYISDSKYGSRIFETAEECLRFEGACDARKGGGGCLLTLMGMIAVAVWILSNIG